MTGIGPVAVRCPRVRDRAGEGPCLLAPGGASAHLCTVRARYVFALHVRVDGAWIAIAVRDVWERYRRWPLSRRPQSPYDPDLYCSARARSWPMLPGADPAQVRMRRQPMLPRAYREDPSFFAVAHALGGLTNSIKPPDMI
jgi:hypothetical protein